MALQESWPGQRTPEGWHTVTRKHSTPDRIRQVRANHFARVSRRYDSIRTLHQGVIDRSVAAVSDLAGPIRIISVGVGTGRYFLPFLRRLAEDPRIDLRGVGLDREPAMLRQLLAKQAKGTDTPVSLVQADAHFLPFRDRSVAAIHCVNAVHHFRLRPFLSEASRILAPGGQILIYTRTPEQNERTIWGRLFPGFVERERRLYTSLETGPPLRKRGTSPYLSSKRCKMWSIRRQPG